MPTYRCPECETVLRRDQPVPEGKKMKRPKCEFVFAPKAVAEKAAKPTGDKSKSAGDKGKPAAKGKPTGKEPPKPSATPAVINDDDEDGGSYTVVHEEEQERAVNYGSLRDKFKKSKRGPSMAKAVKPTNNMLLEGVLCCVGGIATMIIGIWPMVFSEDPTTLKERLPLILGGIFGFAIAAFMSYCLSRFHELTSY